MILVLSNQPPCTLPRVDSHHSLDTSSQSNGCFDDAQLLGVPLQGEAKENFVQ